MNDQDPTEQLRRQEQIELNRNAASREALTERYGQVWDTEEMRQDFEPVGFRAPYLVARKRSDGALGSLQFQHDPRYYFNWKRHE